MLCGCGHPWESISVAIQPLSSVDATEVETIRAGLADFCHCDVTLLPNQELPSSAFNSQRSRYRADALLSFLAQSASTATKIVGITDRDISTSKGFRYDWGIFGLGAMGGRSCVISGFRLQKERVPRALYLERLVKVASHELGHTLGLPHCPTPGCLMHDAEGKVATVDSEKGLCERCAARLRPQRP